MNRLLPSGRSAATLVETMVALVVGAVVLGGLGWLFGIGRNATHYGEALDDLAVAAVVGSRLDDDLASTIVSVHNPGFTTSNEGFVLNRLTGGGPEKIEYVFTPDEDGGYKLARNGRIFPGACFSGWSVDVHDEGDLVALSVILHMKTRSIGGRKGTTLTFSVFRALRRGLNL